VIPLEQVEHHLEVGQRLRQRIADVVEDVIDLVGRGRRLAQHALQVLVFVRGLGAQLIQVAGPALDGITRLDLAVQHRARVLDDVVDVGDVRFEITDDRLRGVHQPLQGGTQAAHRLRCFVEQLGNLVLGQHGQAAVGRIQSRPDLGGHCALRDRLTLRQELARIPGRFQVQVLLTDGRHRVHVGRRVDRDLVPAVDAHHRFGATLGGLDVGDLANGDASIRHVRRRVQTARRGQFGLQRVAPDAGQAGELQVVHPEHEERDHGQDSERDQLASDEWGQQFLSPLSTSGPPGASLGFGV